MSRPHGPARLPAEATRPLAIALAALLAGCPAPTPGGPDGGATFALPDLVVDANRDGRLDLEGTSDEPGEDGFDATAGAVLLANIDDDNRDRRPDADTPEIDSDEDLLDFAPLAIRGRPDLPDGVTATLALDPADAPHARLWLLTGEDEKSAASWTHLEGTRTFDTDTLRRGARLLVEGRDLVTSTKPGAFDGRVEVHLVVRDAGGAELGGDTVMLRVAPVLFQWNTLKTERIYHSDGGSWTRTLAAGIEAMRQDIPRTSIRQAEFDPWAQDFFDVGAMVAPGPDGKPHVIKVALRSPQPDRAAGLYVNRIQGVDWAALEIASPTFDPETAGYSMNSFGNWEVVPPYEKDGVAFPLGRNVWGEGRRRDEKPDGEFVDFVRAQQVQPPIVVDTAWLIVGHADEYLSFVQSDSPRGWALLVARPSGALSMLEALRDAGHGAIKLFKGKKYYDFDDPSWDPPLLPAEVTIDEVLADDDRLASSQLAEIVIDEELEKLQAEIGLADAEIVDMPFLFEEVWGALLAYQPGTVNLLHADGRVLIPKPFGPMVDGADPFETDLVERLGALGLEVYFADDWDTFHINMGEVHCGTNVARDLSVAWWESGR